MRSARLAGLLLAGAVLTGCGVTPPYPASPTTSAPTASQPATTTPAASPLVVVPPDPDPAPPTSDPASPAPEPPATPDSSATPEPSTSPSIAPQPSGKVDCRKARCIALTFDDGPGPYTTTLLGYLDQANVPATFFVLGRNSKAHPKVIRAIAKAGHEIGVHTWDHPILTRLSADRVAHEITSTIAIIEKLTDRRPKLLRPPYGETNATVASQAKKAKVAQILWNVDTLDWKTLSTAKTVAAALKQTRRGSILLLHDIHSTSVAAVPKIIEGLRKKGYTFVTVSRLLGKTKPGRIYAHG